MKLGDISFYFPTVFLFGNLEHGFRGIRIHDYEFSNPFLERIDKKLNWLEPHNETW